MSRGSYNNKKNAKNAKLIMKLTRCDAVKLESNSKNFDIIRLVESKIPVMGHIGYTHNLKKIQGRRTINIKSK